MSLFIIETKLEINWTLLKHLSNLFRF